MTLLDQSLCLLGGGSPEAEIRLRRAGVLTCRQLADEAERWFSRPQAARVRASYAEMAKAESCGLADWFVSHLPPGHRVRALLPFLPDVTFYDIETDGMAAASRITCITTLRAGRMDTFVQGRNLMDFLDVWSTTKILVGFNSKRFDTLAVCRTFGLTRIPAQVDFMDEARHYGYRGGLKTIEKAVGFVRDTTGCADGLEAMRLWNAYAEGGSESALRDLLAYNRDDVRALWHLASRLLRLSLENTQIDALWPSLVL